MKDAKNLCDSEINVVCAACRQTNNKALYLSKGGQYVHLECAKELEIPLEESSSQWSDAG
jgi:hypothetical protein